MIDNLINAILSPSVFPIILLLFGFLRGRAWLQEIERTVSRLQQEKLEALADRDIEKWTHHEIECACDTCDPTGVYAHRRTDRKPIATVGYRDMAVTPAEEPPSTSRVSQLAFAVLLGACAILLLVWAGVQ